MGEVGRIHGGRVPGCSRIFGQLANQRLIPGQIRKRQHLINECHCIFVANGDGFGERLIQVFLHPNRCCSCGLWVEDDIEGGQGQALDIAHARIHGGHHIDLDA